MKGLILSVSLVMAVSTYAQTYVAPEIPVMRPPDRKVYVTSIGDVLEWQPGLGVIVLKPTRTVTQITRRQVSDGKGIVETERAVRVQTTTAPDRTLDRRRASERAADEGRSLMEEVEPSD